MEHFKVGDRVKVESGNDNEGYDDFRDKVLIIIKISTDRTEHPGYDESLAPNWLYDLRTENGEDIGSSLYDYELEPA